MMKYSLIALIALITLLSGSCAGQTPVTRSGPASLGQPADENPAYRLVPGEGAGGVEIGMSEKEITSLLGRPKGRRTFAQEEKTFTDFGYDTSRELLFFIGFDYLLEYSPCANDDEVPVWKLYFKDKRLVFAMYTSFGVSGAPDLSGFGIDPSCYFFSKEEDMIESLGEEYVKIQDEGSNIQFHYLGLGVTPIIVDDQVKVFHVYTPLDEDAQEEFKALVSDVL